MEFTSTFLYESSTVTPSDVRSSKARLVAAVPESGVKWIQVLLRFTNLLYLVFSPSCPLYDKCIHMVKAICEYPTEVIDLLPHHPKAAILWILHLQARHFAQGKMTPNTAGEVDVLLVFNMMYNHICALAIHMVSVAGLPLQLDKEKGPTKRKGTDFLAEINAESKKQKHEENSKPWNKLLQQALEGPLKVAKNPGLTQIKQYCGLAQGDPIVPDVSQDECRHFLLLGRCQFGKKCRFKHGTATDAQAKASIAKLEKFIQEPDGLKGERGNK